MKLRPRQADFVHRVLTALADKGNTLGVAPTGAGKTVMLSSAIAQSRKKDKPFRALVIQHREELVNQNRATLRRVDPDLASDIYAADRKKWSDGVTYAMVQTLSRPDNLDTMPAMDLVVIDEAHHVAASSYKKILERARSLNKDVRILGVTATPERGDKAALKDAFNNVADVISIRELIEAGHLVRPRTYVIDCGLREELAGVKRTISEFDMAEVEAIMDKSAVTEKVIEEWRRLAGERKTIVFCSTIEHARHITQAFADAGVKATEIHGEMTDTERRRALADFEKDKYQVLVNVAIATEGYDCQTIACVVLLRPCSYKSTMIQMVGRGLRKVDPEKHPGVIKTDCVVLDFGYSLLTHGGLETDPVLEPVKGKGMTKDCPSCEMEIPAGCGTCPSCGHIFDAVERRAQEVKERQALADFVMTEVEIMKLSPFQWETFWGVVTMANAMSAWAAIILHGGIHWVICGKDADRAVHLVAKTTDRLQALASADDYLREHGDKDAARKTKRWINEPASDDQLRYLAGQANDFSMTKYRASCLLTWTFKEKLIRAKVLSV